MEDEFEDMVMLTITPRQFRKWDFAAIGFQTAARLVGAVSDGLVDVAGVLLRQSEYEQERHNFHEEAAYDMEQLIAEVEGKD
jgi:hypothetical protein